MDLRISVAARCRIMVGDHYALIISLNGLKRGERSLSPVGGGVKTTDAGRHSLIDELGIVPATFEKGNDLRFRLPEERLSDFRNWLGRTAELETGTAAREFHDEVVEERLLLSRELAHLVTFRLAQKAEARLPMWSYLGGELKLVDTHAFEWIYAVSLPPAVQDRLLQAAAKPEPLVELVTASEISEGRSRAGSEITNLAKSLLQS